MKDNSVQTEWPQFPKKPLATGEMSRAELDAELRKEVASLRSGEAIPADKVDAQLAREFGI